MTSSNGNIFRVTGHLCGEFTGVSPTQKPVTLSFDVFFDLHLNERLSTQSWGWWFETPARPLWRHSNALICSSYSVLLSKMEAKEFESLNVFKVCMYSKSTAQTVFICLFVWECMQCRIPLVKIMTCRLVGVYKPLSEPTLSSIGPLRTNFTEIWIKIQVSIKENEFGNCKNICKMVAIFLHYNV